MEHGCERGQIEVGFSNELYLQAQLAAFDAHIRSAPDADLIVEFGGKPFGDHHAERILPGYDPDIKATIVRELQQRYGCNVAMVVNTRDILHPPLGRTLQGRIRGDTGLRYGEETIRLVQEAELVHGIRVDSVVAAVVPLVTMNQGRDYLSGFAANLRQQTDKLLKYCYEITGYPSVDCIWGDNLNRAFIHNDMITEKGGGLVLLSPGGGSGKFGVALSEIHHRLAAGQTVNFAKFETFPVFNLPQDHPLNLAFIAATADLGNELVTVHTGHTNYDKDNENFALLQQMANRSGHAARYLQGMHSQVSFSVNVIEAGIMNDHVVRKAAAEEIERRLERYRREYARGDERFSTVQRAAEVAGRLAVSRG